MEQKNSKPKGYNELILLADSITETSSKEEFTTAFSDIKRKKNAYGYTVFKYKERLKSLKSERKDQLMLFREFNDESFQRKALVLEAQINDLEIQIRELSTKRNYLEKLFDGLSRFALAVLNKRLPILKKPTLCQFLAEEYGWNNKDKEKTK